MHIVLEVGALVRRVEPIAASAVADAIIAILEAADRGAGRRREPPLIYHSSEAVEAGVTITAVAAVEGVAGLFDIRLEKVVDQKVVMS
jgi:hypothetical protein